MANHKLFIYFFLFSVIILMAITVLSNFSFAAENKIVGKFFQEKGVAAWINRAYLFAVGIIGVLAVATIIFAGIQYMSSVGNPEVIKQAKTNIAAGIAGLLLILLSYTILHTLDPRLVKIGFEVGKLNLIGEEVQNLVIEEPPKKIEAANSEEAQKQCAEHCKDKGTPSVSQSGGAWECSCIGTDGKKIQANAACKSDNDCEKKCKESKKEEECKKLILYCQKDEVCGQRKANWKETEDKKTVLSGKPDGESCEEDIDCQSKICHDYQGKKCYKPLEEGRSCKDDNECESGMCRHLTFGFNECTAIGGGSYNFRCNRDTECASGRCIKAGLDECMRMGGALEGEDCTGDSDCKKGANLYCYKEECECFEGYKWDSKQEKCIKK